MDPRVLDRLRQVSGLDMAHNIVERALRQRCLALDDHDERHYVERLLSDDLELARLIDLVVIPETWFFRDPAAFAHAAQCALQRHQATGRRVRLMSLPCSSGEEPYSLAMALLDVGLAPQAFQIEGLDISPPNLAKARQGLYGRNAFRGQAQAFRRRYFDARDEGLEALQPRVRERVEFAQGNILQLNQAERRGQYDILFCRNLLIYFDEPTQAQAIATLDHLLADDGLLFTGMAEMASCGRHGFVSAGVAGAAAMLKARAVDAHTDPGPREPRAAKPPRVGSPRPRRTREVAAERPARSGAASLPKVDALAALAAELPVGVDTLLVQARRLADSGQLAQAQALLQQLLSEQPSTAQGHFLLALVCEPQDPRIAERHLRRAIYFEPGHYDALCHLALLVEQQGNAEEAARLRQRAGRVLKRRESQP
ncbi:MAG: protein-glutamate O-methyltransferase CheR [Pseudomonas sp.]|uniref:CheR family methyltransferase n=1 Tax=Pseudomonas sp. TaxID=306 RepID=UPI00339A7455